MPGGDCNYCSFSTDQKDAIIITGKKEVKNYFSSYQFITSYQTSPTVKVICSGNDHRSWIDIIVSYKEILKDKSIFGKKYHHQYISKPLTKIEMISKTKDQVIAFNFGHKLNEIFIFGKSHKQFRINHYRIQVYSSFILLLKWAVQIQTIERFLPRQVALQGEIFELEIVLKCETNKTCPEIRVNWIPHQLSKYRDDSHTDKP